MAVAMLPASDCAGHRYGRLVALHCIKNTKSTSALWMCQCDCGNQKAIQASSLTLGRTRSCGCISRERKHQQGTHHASKTVEVRAWQLAKQRCYNKSGANYVNYGGRGIKMHHSWIHDVSAFIRDMGPRPRGYTLDRINNDGDYAPGNCRWATRTQQNNNNRRNRFVTWRGRTQTISQWAKEQGLPHGVLWNRLFISRVSIAAAMTSPVAHRT